MTFQAESQFAILSSLYPHPGLQGIHSPFTSELSQNCTCRKGKSVCWLSSMNFQACRGNLKCQQGLMHRERVSILDVIWGPRSKQSDNQLPWDVWKKHSVSCGVRVGKECPLGKGGRSLGQKADGVCLFLGAGLRSCNERDTGKKVGVEKESRTRGRGSRSWVWRKATGERWSCLTCEHWRLISCHF